MLALTLKDNILLSGSGDLSMCVWSLQTGDILLRSNVHQSGVSCLQFNGRSIVFGSTGNSAKIYDVQQEAEMVCLECHTNLIRTLQALFNVNGEVATIVTDSYDETIRFWEQVPGSHEWRTNQQLHIDSFELHEGAHFNDDEDEFSNRISSLDLDAVRLFWPSLRVWDSHLPCEQ